jgi:glycosyltransferase involved in cell wall biosynthesis
MQLSTPKSIYYAYNPSLENRRTLDRNRLWASFIYVTARIISLIFEAMNKSASSFASKNDTSKSAGDTRPTIVFFDHTARWSGGEISLFNLITHLDQTRFRLVVVLFDEGVLRDKLDAAGIETHVVCLDRSVAGARKDDIGLRDLLNPKQIILVTRFIHKLCRILKNERADIVHCNSLKSDLIGGIAARLVGSPAIWHVRDRIASDYLPSHVARFFRLTARFIPTQIITVSAAVLKTLQLPTSERAVAIHNGTVMENFDFEATPEPFSRPDGAFVVGIVGRLAPWKGQHIFLDAAAHVKRQFPTARFQIVGEAMFGEDEYAAKLRRQSHDLGLDDAVEWLGFRQDVPQTVAKMDMLAHASVSGEPFGQVIIEGMAAGKPVVATDGGGVPEIVNEGETGYLVPMGNPDALAGAISHCFGNPLSAAAMGKAGRKRAIEHFSIEATTRRVEEVYEAMLKASKKRR